MLRIDSKPRDLGGFTVGRLLPHHSRRMVGPFIFFDHIGPADFAPGTGMALTTVAGSAISSSTEMAGSAIRLTKEEFAPFSSRRRTR